MFRCLYEVVGVHVFNWIGFESMFWRYYGIFGYGIRYNGGVAECYLAKLVYNLQLISHFVHLKALRWMYHTPIVGWFQSSHNLVSGESPTLQGGLTSEYGVIQHDL